MHPQGVETMRQAMAATAARTSSKATESAYAANITVSISLAFG